MDKIDLEELERLHNAATPGPWMAVHDINGDIAPFIEGKTGWVLGEGFDPEFDGACWVRPSFDNLEYIVAACNAVPELIARVRELERQNSFFLKALKEDFMCPYSRCKYDYGSELDEWECANEDHRDCWIQAAKEAGE